MCFGDGVCDIQLDSSRIVLNECSGISSGLSIKVGPELPVFFLRFAEFGRVRWFGHPVQYVEPGVHLAKLLQPPPNYRDYLRSSAWPVNLPFDSLNTRLGESQIADSRTLSLPPKSLHPIYSKNGWSPWWTSSYQGNAYRIGNGMVFIVENFQPKLLRDPRHTYIWQTDSI